MIQIFGSVTSPFVRHCRAACMQENIPYELIIADYAASAANSPTKKVPYMLDGNTRLTDSSSILHYIRKKAGKIFLETSEEAEVFFMADTATDTAVNIFIMGNDGLTDFPYMQRQKARLETCLKCLDEAAANWDGSWNDGFMRIACLLEWAVFRKRFQIDEYKNLQKLYTSMEREKFFLETKPH